MTDFEKEVIQRLATIETKAGEYITHKMVLGGVIAVAAIAIGYSEWVLSRVETSVDQRVAKLEEQLNQALAGQFSEFEATLARFVPDEKLDSLNAYMAIGSFPLKDENGKVVGWTSAAGANELNEVINNAMTKAVDEGEIQVIYGNQLFVKENGKLLPLFED
ncbi:hypothetical protein [Ruegeria jejuensis]|uniref:hypothetical protein n=1 Tax=Ruegeria jejuensis TaxID=3233338 RepID=UPI00355B4A7F